MEAFFVSVFVVGIAEIGDKSLFLAILLTMRHQRPWLIFGGLAAGVTLNLSLAAVLGAWLAVLLDGDWFSWVLGLVFLAVAVWALFPEDTEDLPEASRGGIFLSAAIGFFLLEMADKTQIATLALAANYQAFWTVMTGSVIGVLLVNAPAIWLGNRFAGHLPLRALRLGAAALFALIGLWILLDAAL